MKMASAASGMPSSSLFASTTSMSSVPFTAFLPATFFFAVVAGFVFFSAINVLSTAIAFFKPGIDVGGLLQI